MSFPSLIPSSRRFKTGNFPITRHRMMSGTKQTMLYANAAFNAQLQLVYANITPADAAKYMEHYDYLRGTFGTFKFSNKWAEQVWGGWNKKGVDDKQLAINGQWRYAAPPRISQPKYDVVTVEIALKQVPGTRGVTDGKDFATSPIPSTTSAITPRTPNVIEGMNRVVNDACTGLTGLYRLQGRQDSYDCAFNRDADGFFFDGDGARFGTIINVEWHYFVWYREPYEHPASCGAYPCPCIQYYPGVMASYYHQGNNERVTGLVRIVTNFSKGQTITLTATPEIEGEVCPEPDIWEGPVDTPPPTFGPDGPEGGWTSGPNAPPGGGGCNETDFARGCRELSSGLGDLLAYDSTGDVVTAVVRDITGYRFSEEYIQPSLGVPVRDYSWQYVIGGPYVDAFTYGLGEGDYLEMLLQSNAVCKEDCSGGGNGGGDGGGECPPLPPPLYPPAVPGGEPEDPGTPPGIRDPFEPSEPGDDGPDGPTPTPSPGPGDPSTPEPSPEPQPIPDVPPTPVPVPPGKEGQVLSWTVSYTLTQTSPEKRYCPPNDGEQVKPEFPPQTTEVRTATHPAESIEIELLQGYEWHSCGDAGFVENEIVYCLWIHLKGGPLDGQIIKRERVFRIREFGPTQNEPGRRDWIQIEGITADGIPVPVPNPFDVRTLSAFTTKNTKNSNNLTSSTNYPTHNPSTRRIKYGDWNVKKAKPGLSSQNTTLKLPSTAVKQDVSIELTYANREDAVARDLMNHYFASTGEWNDFKIPPDSLTEGVMTGWRGSKNYFTNGHWSYARPPEVASVHPGTSTTKVTLLFVGPEIGNGEGPGKIQKLPNNCAPPLIEFKSTVRIQIIIDDSGSMLAVENILRQMRDTVLKECLLPFYKNDEALYNNGVRVKLMSTIFGGVEHTYKAAYWDTTEYDDPFPTTNIINLVFQDEASPIYTSGAWTINKTPTDPFVSDMSELNARFSNYLQPGLEIHQKQKYGPNYMRTNIFQVINTRDEGQHFKSLLKAVENSEGSYTGDLSTKKWSEIGYTYDVPYKDDVYFYMNMIIDAINKLGYNAPSCKRQG